MILLELSQLLFQLTVLFLQPFDYLPRIVLLRRFNNFFLLTSHSDEFGLKRISFSLNDGDIRRLLSHPFLHLLKFLLWKIDLSQQFPLFFIPLSFCLYISFFWANISNRNFSASSFRWPVSDCSALILSSSLFFRASSKLFYKFSILREVCLLKSLYSFDSRSYYRALK